MPEPEALGAPRRRRDQAVALGLVAAAEISQIPLLYASYPITPASDILHQLAEMKRFGVKTIQAEDEIAAVCAAISVGPSAQDGTGTSTTWICSENFMSAERRSSIAPSSNPSRRSCARACSSSSSRRCCMPMRPASGA